MSTLGLRQRWAGGGLATSIASAVVLVTSSAAAFRTTQDLPEFEGAGAIGWGESTVSFVLQADGPSALPLDDVQANVIDAVTEWSKPTCAEIRIAYRGVSYAPAKPHDGSNTIQWLSLGWEERGFSQDEAAVTEVQYERAEGGEWRIVEADLYLNAEHHEWVLSGNGGAGTRDVRSVVAHEIGHALGLLHPCEPDGADGAPNCDDQPDAADALMFPYYDAGRRNLAPDDEAGICFLYPGMSCRISGCPAEHECTESGCLASCGDALCAPGERCVDGTCALPDPETGAKTPDPTCASDADCASDFRCQGGGCQASVGERGDPCASSHDCATGSCTVDGYCSTPCIENTDCGSDASCDSNGACIGAGRPLGAVCDSADECAGDLCVAGLSDRPVCTRSCDSGHARCPADWRCAGVSGESVCTPLAPVAEPGACAVSGVRPHRTPHLPTLLAFLPLMAWVARRIRRRVRQG